MCATVFLVLFPTKDKIQSFNPGQDQMIMGFKLMAAQRLKG
jgi:hypothetical protein